MHSNVCFDKVSVACDAVFNAEGSCARDGVAVQRNDQPASEKNRVIFPTHTHNRFFFVVAFFIVALQYASLFFIVGVGVDSDGENELGVLEFIHCLVETLDKVRL